MNNNIITRQFATGFFNCNFHHSPDLFSLSIIITSKRIQKKKKEKKRKKKKKRRKKKRKGMKKKEIKKKKKRILTFLSDIGCPYSEIKLIIKLIIPFWLIKPF